jgi:dihydrodipicolinate synthase/N-acetylneuraminate lyase
MPAVRSGRAITGMSAILLPFLADGGIDWAAFEAHVERTQRQG